MDNLGYMLTFRPIIVALDMLVLFSRTKNEHAGESNSMLPYRQKLAVGLLNQHGQELESQNLALR